MIIFMDLIKNLLNMLTNLIEHVILLVNIYLEVVRNGE